MEDLTALTSLVKAEEKEFGASALRPELERRQRRAAWFADVRNRLLDMASDRLEAGRLYSQLAQYGDTVQRLQVFKASLVAAEMITQDQADSVDLRYQDEQIEADTRERAKRRKALDAQFEKILNDVDAGQRQEALRLYNTEAQGPRSKDKLTIWQRLLVDAKLLSASWLPGR